MTPAYFLVWSYLIQQLNYGPRKLSDGTLINFREVRILPWRLILICDMLLGSIYKTKVIQWRKDLTDVKKKPGNRKVNFFPDTVKESWTVTFSWRVFPFFFLVLFLVFSCALSSTYVGVACHLPCVGNSLVEGNYQATQEPCD